MRIRVIGFLAVLSVFISILLLCGGCSKKTATTPGEDGKSKESPAVTEKAPSVPSGRLSFCADFVDVKGTAKSFGKSYVKGNKSRMEITEGTKQSIAIYRGDKQVMWMLDPAQKQYMEMKAENPSSMMGPEAEKALAKLGERKLVGQETVNGYACDKYEFIYHDKNMGKQTHWISKKLGVMVKMEHHNPSYPMSMELKNISEKRIADSLFEIPSGYTKIEIPGMPGQ